MILYCPLCREELDVQPVLDQLEVYSSTTLIAQWDRTSITHTCPDPTEDQPRCGVERGDGLVCNRDPDHDGKHAYAGIFWSDDESVPTLRRHYFDGGMLG